MSICAACPGDYREDNSDAAQTWLYCSAECEHQTECGDGCEYPDDHASA